MTECNCVGCENEGKRFGRIFNIPIHYCDEHVKNLGWRLSEYQKGRSKGSVLPQEVLRDIYKRHIICNYDG